MGEPGNRPRQSSGNFRTIGAIESASHRRHDAVAADIDAGLRRRVALDNVTHMMISILNIASVFFLLSR